MRSNKQTRFSSEEQQTKITPAQLSTDLEVITHNVKNTLFQCVCFGDTKYLSWPKNPEQKMGPKRLRAGETMLLFSWF